MRSREEVAAVLELVRTGVNDCEISRRTGIPRGTIRDWRRGRTPDFERRSERRGRGQTCPVCRGQPLELPQKHYTYLLGLYLGDGCLLVHPRGVYRLRISCARRYPDLIRRCEIAMAGVLPNKVGRATKEGCVDVDAYSKHWPCLFPSTDRAASTNARSSSQVGSRNWSTSTRARSCEACCTPTAAGC